MKPAPFAYHDPRTLDEVLSLLGSLEDTRLLAGGQSLMPMLNMRVVQPANVIDLNGVEELSYIRVKGDALEIGAMTRQRDIEFSDVVRQACPLIHEAVLAAADAVPLMLTDGAQKAMNRLHARGAAGP